MCIAEQSTFTLPAPKDIKEYSKSSARQLERVQSNIFNFKNGSTNKSISNRIPKLIANDIPLSSKVIT